MNGSLVCSEAMDRALSRVREVAVSESLVQCRSIVSYKGLSPAQLDFLIWYFESDTSRRARSIGVIQNFFVAASSFQEANEMVLKKTNDRVSAHDPHVHVVTPSTGWHVVRGYCWGTPWCGGTGDPDIDKNVALRLGPVKSYAEVLRMVGAMDDVR